MATQTRDEWRLKRSAAIGASEVACLYGVGYTSAYDLWTLKAGLRDNIDDDTERMYWGRKIEPVILGGLRDLHDLEVVACDQSEFLICEQQPRLGCTPDAFVYDESRGRGVCEIKNVGEYLASEWADGTPLRFQCQCQAQMSVTGCEWAIVAALVGGNRLVVHTVPRHEAFIADLLTRVEEFWRLVESGEAPEVDGSRHTTRALSILHPSDSGATVSLPEDFAEVASEIAALDRIIKSTEERKAELQNKVREVIGDATYGLLSDGSGWSWKTQTRAAYEVKESTSRVLRFTKGKK